MEKTTVVSFVGIMALFLVVEYLTYNYLNHGYTQVPKADSDFKGRGYFSQNLQNYTIFMKKTLTKGFVEINNSSKIFNDKTFNILFWTDSFHGVSWAMEGAEPFQTCQYKNCYGTTDETQYNSSDAILFHMRFLRRFPMYRFPHQKWIMHVLESPAYKFAYLRFNGIFNATWTYNNLENLTYGPITVMKPQWWSIC